ncbi:MAG TPA: hypothetical protein VFK37_01505 [Bacillales bacterium]|nr:hypothetical protein [Bacillales bacterium]HEU5139617.1 hypothetical protein [Bacillales bacterium]
MTDKSPKDIDRMIKRAEQDDRKARKAERVVDEVQTKAHPQREHKEFNNNH